MDDKDYYQTLGLDRQASPEAVRSAYRRLARQCHPDLNPDDAEAEERFKAIKEAYEVLSDPERRRLHDAADGGFGFTPSLRRPMPSDPADVSDRWPYQGWQARGGVRRPTVVDAPPLPGDDFDRDWEGFGERRPESRGREVEVAVELTLAEAMLGTSRILAFRLAGGREVQGRVRIPPGVRGGTRLRLDDPAIGLATGGEIDVVNLNILVRPRWRFG